MALRLARFKIEGLFEIFDHEIVLSHPDRVTIIHAPNGYGKTVILKLIHDFLNKRFHSVCSVQFRVAHFYFDNGKYISVERVELPREGKSSQPLPDHGLFLTERDADNPPLFNFDWMWTGAATQFEQAAINQIDELIPNLHQVGSTNWIDGDGKRLSISDVITKYGRALPDDLLKSQAPDWLAATISQIDCRFIETQRLLDLRTLRSASKWRTIPAGYRAVVDADASDLASRIGTNLKEYGVVAQRLDQTFPHRIIQQTSSSLSETQLRRELEDLEIDRRRLMKAGLLDQTYQPPLPVTSIDDRIRGVLELYLQDGREKFHLFEDLYKKIDVFTRILNQRLKYKRVEVNKDDGIQIISTRTSKKLPLQSLSSGEQHELVLLYELLFQIKPGALLLIDEPEISLHVAWQKQFIPDLLSVIQLSDFSVLMATHSPQIINDRWDLTIELHGPDHG